MAPFSTNIFSSLILYLSFPKPCAKRYIYSRLCFLAHVLRPPLSYLLFMPRSPFLKLSDTLIRCIVCCLALLQDIAHTILSALQAKMFASYMTAFILNCKHEEYFPGFYFRYLYWRPSLSFIIFDSLHCCLQFRTVDTSFSSVREEILYCFVTSRQTTYRKFPFTPFTSFNITCILITFIAEYDNFYIRGFLKDMKKKQVVWIYRVGT